MPQIPVYNPNQRIEPSSPVAALSTEKAGLMEGMASKFGEALFELGDALDKAQKRASDKAARLESKLALDQLEEQTQYSEIELSQKAVDPKDPTGVNTVKNQFRANINEVRDNIKATLSPEAAELFQSEADGVINNYSAKALAQEVDKREKLIPVLQQKAIGSTLQKAFKDPGKASMFAREAQLHVYESDIPDAAKEVKAFEAAKAAHIQGMLGYLNKDDYTMAKTHLNTELMPYLKDDELIKYTAQIERQKQDKINKEIALLDLEEKQADKLDKKNAKLKESLYTAQLAKIGNNDKKANELIYKATFDKDLLGHSDVLARLQAAAPKAKAYLDEKYEADFMNQFLYKTNFNADAALAKLNRDADSGKPTQVSQAKANDLAAKIKAIKYHEQKNPGIVQYKTAIAKAIAVKYGGRINPLTNEPEMVEQEGANEIMRFNEYYARGIANGNMSVDYLKSYAKKYPELNIESTKTSVNTYMDDKKSLDRLHKLKEEYKKATPEQRKKIIEEVNKINVNKASIEALRYLREDKKNNPAQKTTPVYNQ